MGWNDTKTRNIFNFYLHFSRKGFKCRKILAAIDWNYHVDRPASQNDEGEEQVTRKYNPQTKSWTSKVIKKRKDFGYIPMLMVKIFRQRIDNKKKLDGKNDLSLDDPKRIAPTIAPVQPEASEEIHKRKLEARTRFKNQKKQ